MDLYNYGKLSSGKAKRRRVATQDEISEEELAEMILGNLGNQLGGGGRGHVMAGDKICAKDNHVYFYSPIDESSSFRLNMVLKDVIREMQELSIKYGIDPPPIKLHINSPGGHVFGGLSVVDTIKSSPVEIHSIVEGAAASAATFLSVVCKKRYIKKHAFMLIHQVSSGVWGKMDEIMDEAQNLKRITEVLEDIYLNETNMSRSTLRSLMKHDLWMKPDECITKGCVDEVID